MMLVLQKAMTYRSEQICDSNIILCEEFTAYTYGIRLGMWGEAEAACKSEEWERQFRAQCVGSCFTYKRQPGEARQERGGWGEGCLVPVQIRKAPGLSGEEKVLGHEWREGWGNTGAVACMCWCPYLPYSSKPQPHHFPYFAMSFSAAK